MKTKLQYAMEWHKQGFSVIPVHYVKDDGSCSCNQDCGSPGKHPALRTWTQYQVKRASEITLISWFEPEGRYEDYNLGVVTGAVSGNVFVLDIDVGPGKEGLETLQDLLLANEELPITLEQTTGGGGIHFFFRAPEGTRVVTDKNTIGPDGDTRGEGGFVVVAPSNHKSGGSYRLRDNQMAAIADCPFWRLGMVSESAQFEGDTGFQSESTNKWGELTDGREGYMVKLLMGCIRTSWAEKGEMPTVPQLLEEAWPTFEHKAASRGQSLEADGRGQKLMEKKAKYLLGKAEKQQLRILEGVEPGSESEVAIPRPKLGGVKVGNLSRKPLRLTDHYLKTFEGEPPEQKWIIENKIPLGVAGIVAGPGGVGKSYLMLDLALKVAGGDQGMHQEWAFGGRVVHNGKVVYITAEDSRDAIHRRLAAIPDPTIRERAKDNLIIVALPDEGGAFSMIGKEYDDYYPTPAYNDLRKQIIEINPDLMILDPLQPFAAADVNSDPAAAQAWWTQVNELCAKLKITILVTHHMRKEGTWSIRKAAQAREAIRGTTALVDGARIAIAMWLLPEHEEQLLADKLGFEAGQGNAVAWAVVKANDYADMSVNYGIRSDFGLLVDRTAEAMEILDASGSLEDGQVASIFNEIKRRWAAENPFSIGTNTTRSFIAYLKNEYGCSQYAARSYLQNWIDHGNLEDSICDSKKKMRGIRVIKEPYKAFQSRTMN